MRADILLVLDFAQGDLQKEARTGRGLLKRITDHRGCVRGIRTCHHVACFPMGPAPFRIGPQGRGVHQTSGSITAPSPLEISFWRWTSMLRLAARGAAGQRGSERAKERRGRREGRAGQR